MTFSAFRSFDGLLWLAVSLLPFILVQRWLHQELQMVLWLVTRRERLALMAFAFLFFPGVLLHELSHFVAARLVGVRTGRFSLWPRVMPGGRLRLGYVETVATDFVRDTIIGTAPLLTGGAVIVYTGGVRLGLLALAENTWQGGAAALWDGLSRLPAQPDFWLWFYVTLAVSSTMLPSASDRRGWLPFVLVLGGLLVLVLALGAGPWLLTNLGPAVNRIFQVVATVFAISLAVHLALAVPVWGLRRLICRVSGLRA